MYVSFYSVIKDICTKKIQYYSAIMDQLSKSFKIIFIPLYIYIKSYLKNYKFLLHNNTEIFVEH
jgi:hypothetical protein